MHLKTSIKQIALSICVILFIGTNASAQESFIRYNGYQISIDNQLLNPNYKDDIKE